MATIDINILQAIADLDSIKIKIQDKGVEVSEGTHTSEYPEKIETVHINGYESGLIAGKEQITQEFEAVKNAIIDNGIDVSDATEISDYADKVDAVYQKGYEVGFEEGKTEGGSGGSASDPAAEAVMALLRDVKFTYTQYDVGLCVYRPRMENGITQSGFAILPEQTTEIKEDLITTDTDTILCLPKVPPTVPWLGFWSVDGANQPPKVIYVPDESIIAYKTAENWSDFAHLFKPMSYLYNKITFSIDGDEYTAIPDMTWEEWIGSNYNTSEGRVYVNINSNIEYMNGEIHYPSSGESVPYTDTIIEGAEYYRYR